MADLKTTFYIARHGETEFNTQEIMQGYSLDSPLTENGVKQAEELREKLKDVRFDAVYSSDLMRAQKTAEIIAKDLGLPLNTTKLLRERSYGKFDGRHVRFYREEYKEMFEKMAPMSYVERKDIKLADDMESDGEVAGRIEQFIKETALSNPGKNILVITHGGIMRQFLIHIGWANPQELVAGTIKNSGYIKVASDGSSFIIEETVGVDKKIIK